MTREQSLRAALGWLDKAIEREIVRLRGRYELSLDEFRGLYVGDAQVDDLLRTTGAQAPGGVQPPLAALDDLLLGGLAQRFALDPIERALVLLALAVEIDPRYPPLFAYLNDDAAHRRPTLDLAMRLLATDWPQREAVRKALSAGGRLPASGLIALDPAGASGLQASLRLAPAAIQHLLGGDALAQAGIERIAPPAQPAPGALVLASALGAQPLPLMLLEGRSGTGRAHYAASLAAARGLALTRFDLRQAGPAEIDAAALAARIAGTALLVVAADPVEPAVMRHVGTIATELFVAVPVCGPWERELTGKALLSRSFEIDPYESRLACWREALRREGLRASPAASDQVAQRFRLTSAAIARAAGQVRLTALAEKGSVGQVSAAQLQAAARAQCAIDLVSLATRVSARPSWDDLVVPSAVLEQLKDFAAAGAQRDRVYRQWGMGSVGRSAGCGVAALFAGASGTGKTLSAAVIASGVGLDLWKIDLSSVVSKYIGETEKNLEKIFAQARDGDAILFFDEADALFGKRSEVKDAHDRYANVEVAYLLQKLEEYDGITILASNFSRNIDQAFVRRLNYIIDFPLPDERLRQCLWRKAFSASLPRSQDIDYVWLGNAFPLAGGDIRSAALDAAFLAAAAGEEVAMKHISRAVSRQMLKQGQLPGIDRQMPWADVLPYAEAAE